MENKIVGSEYIEFEEIDEVKDWGSKYYREWARQHKENMRVAREVVKSGEFTSIIEYYCGYAYRGMNEYLRFGENGRYNSPIEDALIMYNKWVSALAIILSMAPRIPCNIVAYRLVCDVFVEELMENNKKGSPTKEKGFISTSLTKNIINVTGEGFFNHNNLLKIYVKANTVGIYVNEVVERSEHELLLYPNGYFRLLKNPYKYKNKTIYECELCYFFQEEYGC